MRDLDHLDVALGVRDVAVVLTHLAAVPVNEAATIIVEVTVVRDHP